MKLQFLLNAALECNTFIGHERVALGDYGHNISDPADSFHHGNIKGGERMASGSHKVQNTMDSRIVDSLFSLRGQFLSEIGRVLVLDKFDNWFPASVIIDQIAKSRSIGNAQLE